MTTLKQALEDITPKQRPGMIKHLRAAGINKWEDFTRCRLARFASQVKESVAPSSAHTIFAVLKSFISQHEEEIPGLPRNWREVLKAKNERPMKTYLTAGEVEAFGRAWVDNDRERTVRDGFYVSCKTGLRHSDLVKLSPANFTPKEGGGYYLNYVSRKTKVQSTVVCSEATKERAYWIRYHGVDVSLSYYNDMVRELAHRADISEEVAVFRAGRELSGPKWRFLSSHSARVSFCTILADYGTDVLDIAKLAGHRSIQTTMGYIVNREVKLSEKALGFLM